MTDGRRFAFFFFSVVAAVGAVATMGSAWLGMSGGAWPVAWFFFGLVVGEAAWLWGSARWLL